MIWNYDLTNQSLNFHLKSGRSTEALTKTALAKFRRMGSWKYESGQRELYAVKTAQVGITAANTDYAGFDPAAAYQFMDK